MNSSFLLWVIWFFVKKFVFFGKKICRVIKNEFCKIVIERNSVMIRLKGYFF
jgi:hypothetical protein